MTPNLLLLLLLLLPKNLTLQAAPPADTLPRSSTLLPKRDATRQREGVAPSTKPKTTLVYAA
jgi:hypothetical protein